LRRPTIKKTERVEIRPDALGLDFHNHLIPGVDDGVESYEDAILTIAGLKKLGFSGAVLTPHLYAGVFDNQAAKLRIVFDEFSTALKNGGIEFQIYLAGEYFADDYFLKLIEQGDLLSTPVGGERWVLLEFPYLQESPFTTACLAALVSHGYRPVIAHLERYRFAAQNPEGWLEQFARYNAVLQGDIGSLAGQHGEAVKRFAGWLLDRNHIAIWGTDIHKSKQIERHIVPGLAQLKTAGRTIDTLNPRLMEITS
jgi:tyrosine-protein phosphatase YwqE